MDNNIWNKYDDNDDKNNILNPIKLKSAWKSWDCPKSSWSELL